MQGRVRDLRATYEQSLAVLQTAKACGVYTKSSIMLGLGETQQEVEDCMLDLYDCGVDIVTLGQYLQPTAQQLPVAEYITPEAFDEWKRFGEETIGFRYACFP
jgi:lipoyl synthase